VIPFIDFKPLAEFTDRLGHVRPIAGCSVLGRLEFWERVERLYDLMKEAERDDHWQQLYHSSKEFRHTIHTCLTLNGIDPDWLTFDQLQALLFHRVDEESGELRPGWLMELNTPPTEEPTGKAGDPLTAEELVAALAATAGSLKDALELAQHVRPADFLLGIAQAQAELKDQESRERRQRKKVVQRLKRELGMDEIKRLIQTPIEQLQAQGAIHDHQYPS
jgi:hypothetical protein